MHLLMTGQEDDWDRRLIVENAPAFAILGEPVTLTLRVEDEGAAPEARHAPSSTSPSTAASRRRFDMPIGAGDRAARSRCPTAGAT